MVERLSTSSERSATIPWLMGAKRPISAIHAGRRSSGTSAPLKKTISPTASSWTISTRFQASVNPASISDAAADR